MSLIKVAIWGPKDKKGYTIFKNVVLSGIPESGEKGVRAAGRLARFAKQLDNIKSGTYAQYRKDTGKGIAEDLVNELNSKSKHYKNLRIAISKNPDLADKVSRSIHSLDTRNSVLKLKK